MDSWTSNLLSVFKSFGSAITEIKIPAEHKLVVTTDTLIESVHFPENTPAHAIGYKSLAVNLSDLAAMGASPHCCSLMLVVPKYSENWIQEFAKGWQELSAHYQLPLCEVHAVQAHKKIEIHVTAFGLLDKNQGLFRHTAQEGDLIYVSGALGEAAAGLSVEFAAELSSVASSKVRIKNQLVSRLRYPSPRLLLGQALSGVANACLDVSDGLIADLGHITERSNVTAKVYCERIYLSKALNSYCDSVKDDALDYALAGGDDYELCFTVPPAKRVQIGKIEKDQKIRLSCIGEIHEQAVNEAESKIDKVQVIDEKGKQYHPKRKSYEHFG